MIYSIGGDYNATNGSSITLNDSYKNYTILTFMFSYGDTNYDGRWYVYYFPRQLENNAGYRVGINGNDGDRYMVFQFTSNTTLQIVRDGSPSGAGDGVILLRAIYGFR